MGIKKERSSHSPEVENLMDGKTPFVTRWGVTIVVFFLVLIIIAICVYDNEFRRFVIYIWGETLAKLL